MHPRGKIVANIHKNEKHDNLGETFKKKINFLILRFNM